MLRRAIRVGVSIAIGVLLATTQGACGMDGAFSSGPGGNFGATPGGVKDMGLAREMIAEGQIPPPEAFVVEGMFSEHDLPLAGEPCSTLLCVRGALGIAPTAAGDPSGWFQVGLSSTIDPETYERPSLTIVATVDVSGSMGWDYSDADTEYPTPGALAQRLLTQMAGQLTSRDRIAIVSYGSEVHDVLGFTAGDSPNVLAGIERLGDGGSTNMEAGLTRAYALMRGADLETAQKRILLFTDAQPNVGATGGSDFERLAASGAAEGVGLTVLAVGLGIGQEVLTAMSHLRGGNAFSVFTGTDIETLMADEWPWLVSPIAYDLSLKVTPGSDFRVAETFGFPAGSDPATIELAVSTVFLSKRKGALLVRLAPRDGVEDFAGLAVAATLDYRLVDGTPVAGRIDAAYDGTAPDEAGRYAEQRSVGETVALALLVSGMKQAATEYATSRPAAVATMTAVAARFASDAAALADPALDPEVELADALLALMEAGAPQGSLYGGR
jgi:Ca-activated chloride channel family protein